MPTLLIIITIINQKTQQFYSFALCKLYYNNYSLNLQYPKQKKDALKILMRQKKYKFTRHCILIFHTINLPKFPHE